MRKLNVLEFVSLDGVMQAPGGPEEDTSSGFAYGGWTSPHGDEVSSAAVRKQMNTPCDLLLGGKLLTYGHNSGRNMAIFGRASTLQPNMSPRIPSLLTNGSRPCF